MKKRGRRRNGKGGGGASDGDEEDDGQAEGPEQPPRNKQRRVNGQVITRELCPLPPARRRFFRHSGALRVSNPRAFGRVKAVLRPRSRGGDESCCEVLAVQEN